MDENDRYSNSGSESYSESEDDNMLAGMSEEQRVSYGNGCKVTIYLRDVVLTCPIGSDGEKAS